MRRSSVPGGCFGPHAQPNPRTLRSHCLKGHRCTPQMLLARLEFAAPGGVELGRVCGTNLPKCDTKGEEKPNGPGLGVPKWRRGGPWLAYDECLPKPAGDASGSLDSSRIHSHTTFKAGKNSSSGMVSGGMMSRVDV